MSNTNIIEKNHINEIIARIESGESELSIKQSLPMSKWHLYNKAIYKMALMDEYTDK
jgi:hypothetical protein